MVPVLVDVLPNHILSWLTHSQEFVELKFFPELFCHRRPGGLGLLTRNGVSIVFLPDGVDAMYSVVLYLS